MIDFVILWVDGSDPKWIDEYNRYLPSDDIHKESLFRSWDNLEYWFRGVERFSPWVNKIHFVTWGHIPKWLNPNHPKLNIVKHSDYIDDSCLPTFNSHPIEINLHRIEGLAEKFVLFNDDTFLISSVLPERFFVDGLPCDLLISNALSSSSGVGHFVLNNLEILNRHFKKSDSIKRDFSKWFSPKYGRDILRNIALLPWSRFTGFVDPHMPQPYLKSTFDRVWQAEERELLRTSSSRFRGCDDISPYLFRYWHLVKGEFVPMSTRDTKYMTIDSNSVDSGLIDETILSGRYNMVCLNDGGGIDDTAEFERAKRGIQNSLMRLLPDKSSYEL
ncbi:Glycosyltransferase [hydrothermal vent metagenome]|uniref:Glycosyltransferase n=1 Tax=hydrothermal vent metagenome TaxID=652676 RepID=A0A1W1BTF1_9ZZZZ